MQQHVTSPREEHATPANLISLLRSCAAQHGTRQVFRFADEADPDAPGRTITYEELHVRAMAIAGELQRQAAPGERALLLFPPGLDFISAFFGCLYAGIVAVPVAIPGRNRVTSFLEAIVAAAEPVLILSTADHVDQAARSYAPGTGLLRRRWIAVDQISNDLQHAWRDPRPDAGQTAFLQYTSGSTSSPKGVILSHANLLANAEVIRQAFGNDSTSSAVFWLPLHHDMGLIGGVVQPIYCGGSCTLLAPTSFLQRPALWLEMISQTGANVSGGPDFAYDLCVRKVPATAIARLDLSRWKVAFTGAERIRVQTLERFAAAFAPCGFRRAAFFPCYGLAEATLMVSGGPSGTAPAVVWADAEDLAQNRVRDVEPDAAAAHSVVGCGAGLPGQRIAVVDPHSLATCADSEVGEIWVQGPSVACGYYRSPEATAETFAARIAGDLNGAWLRTGDLGFLRDGQLFVTGRLKDLIIIRGRNFYPEDLEHSADRAYFGLRAGYCAAFAVAVDDRDQLVLIQEVEPRHRQLDAAAALEAIRRAIAAEHELEVHTIVLVKAGTIPKTSSGKTRRSACKELFLGGKLEPLAAWQAEGDEFGVSADALETAGEPRAATAAEIEAWLVQAIAARLRISSDSIRVTTPFLELGMGSLDAMEIAADLARWLRRRLSPLAIYSHPCISALAHRLAHTPSAAGPTRVATSDPLLPAETNSQQLFQQVQNMTDNEMECFIRQEMARQERT